MNPLASSQMCYATVRCTVANGFKILSLRKFASISIRTYSLGANRRKPYYNKLRVAISLRFLNERKSLVYFSWAIVAKA